MYNRLLKLFISVIYHFFRTCCCYILTSLNFRNLGTFEVLYYHEIRPEHRAKFEKHIKDIVRYTQPVSADYTGPLMSGKHYVAVTFDDGFQCLIDSAFPELEKFKIPYTVFIPSKYIGRRPGWITHSKHSNYNERVMTPEQIKNILTGMASIGSHCATHPRLTSLEPEKVREELAESKSNLEKMFGKDIKLLAFPYGEYNEEIIEQAKIVGYSHIYSGLPTMLFSNKFEFLRGRIPVSADDWTIEFRLKLKGAYEWLTPAVAAKKKIRKFLSGRNKHEIQ